MSERGRGPQAELRERWALVAIVLLGLALRLARLGALSFAGDEETTTLAARALLEGWPPTLPGGLVYVRALPFTALESLAIWLCGSADEWVLRLVPALLAAPRIAAAWHLARPFLPAGGALGVALGLALAPLDVEYSRIARMYSLFATLDVAFVACLVQLAGGIARGWAVSLFGIGAASVHALSITHVPLAWVALLARGVGPRARALLIAVGALGLAAFALEDRVLASVYAVMGAEGGRGSVPPLDQHLERLSALVSGGAGALLAALGALAGAGLALWGCRELSQPRARALALGAALAGALASPLLGLCAVLAALILESAPQRLRQHGALLCGAVLAGTAGWAAAALLTAPDLRAGLGAAAHVALGFPAPNWLELARAWPLLWILALCGAVRAARAGSASPRPGPWLVLIGAAFAPALVSGLVARSDGLRFQLHSVPPLLVLAALALEGALRALPLPHAAARTAVALAALVALRPDLAVLGVLREHGRLDDPFAQLAVAPDHRGAGHFVRAHADAQDWVVSEDPLQQYLYAGRSEYWLRSTEDAAAFLRSDAAGGAPREVYTGAQLLPDAQALLALSRAQPGRRIWLITSAEVEIEPQFYRTPQTQAQLDAWRERAVFTGADGLTRVLLLVDGAPSALPVPAGAP